MELLIFTANQTGNKKNCYYPKRVVAKNAAELQKTVMMDHVCAEYRNDYRSNANFMQSVVVVMDCDNDHSELPGDWMRSRRRNGKTGMLKKLPYTVCILENNEI